MLKYMWKLVESMQWKCNVMRDDKLRKPKVLKHLSWWKNATQSPAKPWTHDKYRSIYVVRAHADGWWNELKAPFFGLVYFTIGANETFKLPFSWAKLKKKSFPNRFGHPNSFGDSSCEIYGINWTNINGFQRSSSHAPGCLIAQHKYYGTLWRKRSQMKFPKIRWSAANHFK